MGYLFCWDRKISHSFCLDTLLQSTSKHLKTPWGGDSGVCESVAVIFAALGLIFRSAYLMIGWMYVFCVAWMFINSFLYFTLHVTKYFCSGRKRLGGSRADCCYFNWMKWENFMSLCGAMLTFAMMSRFPIQGIAFDGKTLNIVKTA